MLLKNFERSYNGMTRAPIGIYIHSAWFIRENSWHFEGYKMFLEHVLALSDVYIVPIKTGIEYFQANNVTSLDLFNGSFEPFNCNPDPKPENCRPVTCQ